MSAGTQFNRIPKEQLWDDYYENLHGAYNSMRNVFHLRATHSDLTQDELAYALDVDKSLISRRLNGDENLTLKTLSFMGTGMQCRLIIQFKPYEELGEGNNYLLESEVRRDQGETSSVNVNTSIPTGPSAL